MKYGLPYKGSKNRLAERIVRLLPKRTNLVDLFCGGCAVSHAALLMGKFEHIYINDINWMCPTLFMDALQGKYANDTRWISKEDFFRLRKTDPFVAVAWSFGNDMRSYLYSKEIEPLKKAIHYALFFSDYSLAKALGYDLSFVNPITDVQQRYRALKRYFSQSEHFRLQSFEAMERVNKTKHKCPSDEKTISNSAFGKELHIESFENAERIKNQNVLFCVEEVLPITPSVLRYEQVVIPPDSVIYCDIPYKDTSKYKGVKGFDYEHFYTWAENQTSPVFISSYQMPTDRFDCIAEWPHRSTLNAKKNNAVIERIFVPKHQNERGNICQQLSLF